MFSTRHSMVGNLALLWNRLVKDNMFRTSLIVTLGSVLLIVLVFVFISLPVHAVNGQAREVTKPSGHLIQENACDFDDPFVAALSTCFLR